MNKSDFRILETPSGKFYVQRLFKNSEKVGVWPFRKKTIKHTWETISESGNILPKNPRRSWYLCNKPKQFKSLKKALKWIENYCTPNKYHYPVEVVYGVDTDPFIKVLNKFRGISAMKAALDHIENDFPEFPEPDIYPPEFPKDR